jgi:MFS family permease
MNLSDRQAIWCLAVGQTLVWAGIYYIFPTLIVRWEADFGWSRAELTGAITVAILASAAFAPVSGRLIDKGYGPLFLPGGCFVGGLLLISLYFVQSLEVFYVVWALIGVCMAFSLYEPCFAIIIRTKGITAQRYITIVTLVAGLAGTVAFPLGHMISELAGWRVAVLVFAAVVIFVGTPLLRLGSKNLEEHSSALELLEVTAQTKGRDRFRFLWGPAFWLIALSFTFLYMTHTALINHFLLLLQDRQFDPDIAVLAASFIGPMQVIGRLLVMFVERYVSIFVICIMCFVFSMAAIVCLIYATMIPQLLIVFIILQGSGIGVSSITKPIITREILGGDNFGLKSGAQAVPYFIGAAFSALIASLLWSVGGYDLVLQVLLVLIGLGLVALILAGKIKPVKP